MARLSKDDKPEQYKARALNTEQQRDADRMANSTQSLTAANTSKVKPVVTTESPFRAVPMLTDLPAMPDDTVVLVEKKTGKRTPMTRSYANRFVRKNPLTHYVA